MTAPDLSALPPEIAALLRVFDAAAIRLGILRDRMEACDAGDRTSDGHALSRFEIEGWIEEQDTARAALVASLAPLVLDAELGKALREALEEADAMEDRWLYVSRTHAFLRVARNVLTDTERSTALQAAIAAARTPTGGTPT